MLKLDTSKIRKGKPVGLPYQGSKKKIAKKLVEIIKQNFDSSQPIYDVFGGGGAFTAECIIQSLDVHYNDASQNTVNMFLKVLQTDRENLKSLIISREEFFKIREKQEKTIDDHLKLLVNSFGNNRRTYLYAKEFSDLKYKLALEVMKNHDVFHGYKQTATYKEAYQSYLKDDPTKLKSLEQLQQLQAIRTLGRVNELNLNGLTYSSLDYTAFSDIEGAIFYLDPPYENTQQKGYEGEFDSLPFYDWAVGMSKKNIVLLSSYFVSDPRFEMVYHFEKSFSTLKSGQDTTKSEKLFMVKDGLGYERSQDNEISLFSCL